MMLPPGNYTGMLYETLKEYITVNIVDENKYDILNDLSNFKEKEGILMLVDVDKFSEFCKAVKLEKMVEYLRTYFDIIPNSILEYQGGTILKFVGDAIFAIIEENKNISSLVVMIEDIRKKYFIEMKYIVDEIPDIAVVLKKGKFVEGLARSRYYLDYSVWGRGVNTLFKIIKIIESPGIFINESIYNELKIDKEGFKKVNGFYYRKFKEEKI